MRYGMPYKGSKNKIAEWIVDQLPKAKHFYDLFGGGGAISHCATLSGKYEVVHYNELNTMVYNGFNKFIRNEYEHESRWISREEFNKLKDKDFYVASCFSFGNDLKWYAYGKNKEQFKKALHYAICFNDFSLLEELSIFIDKSTSGRLNIIREVKNFIKINRLELESLQSLQSLQSLESLERLQRLQSFDDLNGLCNLQRTNLDYRDVSIEEDSVIYCDIPYKDTKLTSAKLDYDAFYDYCLNNNNIVFVSEYMMPSEFISVNDIVKTCNLNVLSKNKTTIERVFIPKKKEEEYLLKIGIL